MCTSKVFAFTTWKFDDSLAFDTNYLHTLEFIWKYWIFKFEKVMELNIQDLLDIAKSFTNRLEMVLESIF